MAETKITTAASPYISPERLRELYGWMVQLDAAQENLHALFCKEKWPLHRMPDVTHLAVMAGCFAHLRRGDMVTPASCGFAANLIAGASASAGLRDLQDAAGVKPGRPGTMTISSQIAMLAGVGKALQLAGGSALICAQIEDSARADSANTASLRRCNDLKLPMVFVSLARTAPKPGEMGKAAPLPEIAVDGSDVPAIYRVMQESAHRARTGIGPTWIRCVVLSGRKIDPLAMMEAFLQARGHYRPAQNAAERTRWAKSWKHALIDRKKVHADPPGGPVAAFDVTG